jgi:2-keto-3-deoxy-L-rhamnonate aldolase RhmA
MADDHPSKLHEFTARKKVLLGCGCDSISPVSAELAATLGFDAVWADLEHGPASWREAQTFCQAAKAGGALGLLRVPSARRHHILHALDVGADIVVVPMVDSRATAEQVVEHGKYAPLGKRGFAGSPRGIRYGCADDKLELVRQANRQTHLFVQIETAEALERCRDIVSVEGLSGGLVGPADLSFSLGRPLDFSADFIAHYVTAIRTIRAAGKIAATATAVPELIAAGLEAGLQIIVCASEIVSLRNDWGKILQAMKQQIARANK